MRKIVAEKLLHEVAEWGHAGLLEPVALATLRKRYDSAMSLGRVLLRWLGFAALFLLGSSVLGLITLVAGDGMLFVAPLLLAGFAAAAWIFGVRFATDPLQRFAISGSVLVTLSFLLLLGALLTAYGAVGGARWQHAVAIMMVLTAGAAILTAYQHGLRWPLALGVLCLFHALGNRHGYWGSGSYFLNIQDEWLMLLAASASVALGVWHERVCEASDASKELGFGHLYVIFGLLYANLSLWILSLGGQHGILIGLFALACVFQLVLGARLHDGRFTGFGIVFLSINIYTRMFEHCWDDTSKGLFFLACGLPAVIAGIVFEARAKRLRDAA